MTTLFPGAQDDFDNPLGTDGLLAFDHAALHSNVNDAVEAIEAAIGTPDVADPNSLTERMVAVEAVAESLGGAALLEVGQTPGTVAAGDDARFSAETTTTIGDLIAGAADKPTPVDTDLLGLSDSAAANVLKKFSWSALKTWLTGIFARLAGVSGGQTLQGGTSAGETLTLQSTAHATKGKILLGVDTAYDEVNGWLGIGTASPVARLTSYLTTANIAPTVGPEILSSSGWTSTGWTGDFATGFTHTPGNTSVLSYPSFTAASTLEYFYRLKYTITGRTAGSVTITVGSVAKDLVTTTGVLSFDTNSTLLKPVKFTPTSDFDGTISALQLSLVTKSEALWATLDAAGKTDFEFRFSHFNSFMQMMGRNAGSFYTITTGATRNCGYGKEAFYHLVEGVSNSAFGGSDLFALAKGNYNSAFGSFVANSLRQGDNNTFCGAFANRYLKYGSGNTYLGASPVALATLTLANDMTWIGASSGTNALQGNDLSNSTAIGANSYTTASNQIVLGNSAITEVRTSGKFYSAGAELTDSTLPLRLRYSAGVNVDFVVDSAGKLKISAPLSWMPAASHTPAVNLEICVEFTNDTTLTFRGKGSDGTVRAGTLTLS